jgi:hypothetical protein
MCAIYLGTRLLYRDRAMVNALGAAALGLLVFDPRQLFTASFQMTFVCVLIVAAIGLPLVERTSRFYRQRSPTGTPSITARQLPPRVAQFRVDLQLIAARLARFLGKPWSLRLVRGVTVVCLRTWELLLVSAVMQMGLALPMAYYFHRATTIGLPANVAVVPLTQLLMPAAVLTVGLGYVSPLLAKLPALLTAFALQAITGTVHGLGGLRLADLRVATPSVPMMGAASAALILAMILRSPSRAAGGDRTGCPAAGLPDSGLRPAATEHASRSAGSDFYRCGRRRRHPASNAARPHFADRRRRPHLSAVLRNSTSGKTWSRLTSGRAVSPGSTPSRFRTPTPITSEAWLQC